jgi:Tfp pilus assembly ATPase PilU
MEIGSREGNRTIDQTLSTLLENGYITREEALFHCREQKRFEEAPKPQKQKSIWT